MSEDNSIPTVAVKSENFFSSNSTEYQYFPYKNGQESFIALTFFRGDVEADLSSGSPSIISAKKALCTISLNFDLAKLLVEQLTPLVQSEKN